MSEVKLGTVVFFKKEGWGFIKPDVGDKDYFVHYSQIQGDGFKTLAAGQRVTFEIGFNNHGEQAANVVVLEEDEDE